MNLFKLISIILIVVFTIYNEFDKNENKYSGSSSFFSLCDEKKDKNLTDTLLLGFWGYDISTDNCALWIVKDSIYFVDTDTWCSYTIHRDTITMFHDNVEYMKANYYFNADSLFFENEYLTIGYGKCNNGLK